jgi:HlyD family secretion protein
MNHMQTTPRPLWKRPIVLVGVLVVAALALWLILRPAATKTGAPAAATAKGASAPAQPSLTVTLTSPQRADWPQTVSANGGIAAWQEAVIGAEVPGLRLTEVAVQIGDRVRRGQLLARLQSATTEAEAATTRANIAEAEASLAEAQANAERARQLQATGAISAQQIQQYTTGEQTARARVAALRARADADRVRLAQTRIVAPDDGVISARTATVGAVVQPGQELFRLIRQQRLEWRAEVAATDLVKLAPGMPVTVTPAGGRVVTGKLRMVAPTVDAATRNGTVYVDLPEPGDAKAGMFARGEFEIGRASGLTLPQSAVLQRDGFSYVFLLGADNRVKQQKVQVGRRNGEQVEVASGLDANARVVAAGAGFLADGDTVRVVSAAVAAASK